MSWDKPANGSETIAHGFPPAYGEVGVDVRLNKDIAIALAIGSDECVFVWRSGTGSRGPARAQ